MRHLLSGELTVVGGKPPRSVAAFTLIELLITISIIGALLVILTPAFKMARIAALDTKCMSNMHQVSIGWQLYFQDHEFFPGYPQPGLPRGPMMFDWGGVDWYEGFMTSLFDPRRPLNPYIATDFQEKARAEVFHCPRDFGWFASGTNYRIRYEFASGYLDEFSGAEDAVDTLFGVMGTSYRANEWMWAKPGDPNGFATGSLYGRQLRNRPTNVPHPSRFVLVGDGGSFLVGRYARETRSGPPLPPQFADLLPPGGIVEGWWHGYEVCTMTFLDGSVRRYKMTPGTAATNEYSFWIDPDLHGPDSTVYAHSRRGSGRPPNSY